MLLKDKKNLPVFFESVLLFRRHTAAILRSIGQDYMRESKWDYLYSEIESI